MWISLLVCKPVSHECVVFWNILETVLGLKIKCYSLCMICPESMNILVFVMYTHSRQLSIYTEYSNQQIKSEQINTYMKIILYLDHLYLLQVIQTTK